MTIMRMIMTTIMMISTLTTQANLDLKERMAAALEREERARAELQDSKDQVRKAKMVVTKRLEELLYHELFEGGAA